MTWKLSNVRPPQVTTVELPTAASRAVPLMVHGKLDALATPSESNEKANKTKVFFIASPPNRISNF
jgi:hypothetical protein